MMCHISEGDTSPIFIKQQLNTEITKIRIIIKVKGNYIWAHLITISLQKGCRYHYSPTVKLVIELSFQNAAVHMNHSNLNVCKLSRWVMPCKFANLWLQRWRNLTFDVLNTANMRSLLENGAAGAAFNSNLWKSTAS